MKTWKFKGLYQGGRWMSPAYVICDEDGVIASVSKDAPKMPFAMENVSGFAIPGFVNAHSHAFQYLMAGLAEIHNPGNESDDFWSWRENMYRIAMAVEPEDLYAIAAMLYSELCRYGYTRVVEFHYLHNDKKGHRYSNPIEMSQALIQAAEIADIDLTLVPIFYQKGGFDLEPSTHQGRFVSQTLQDYHMLVELVDQALKPYPHHTMGQGVHSIRAAGKHEIIELAASKNVLTPFHIHISEQQKEVEDCLRHYGQRPVQWLSEHLDFDHNLNLVHATHLDDGEVDTIASGQARVVLCPSTEGNLGDGLFPFGAFTSRGGHWTIGTDSHIGLNPFEELRILDYGQRLTTQTRRIFNGDSHDSGSNAFNEAVCEGNKSSGKSIHDGDDFFKPGDRFGAVIIDADQPLMTGNPEHLISTCVYSGDPGFILGTINKGRWIVKRQRHINRESIINSFIITTKRLDLR